MRNDDLTAIKWQIRLMTLIPVGSKTRGKSADEIRQDMTGAVSKGKEDKESKNLVRKIQKTLRGLANDKTFGDIERFVKDPTGYKALAEGEETTATIYYRWKGNKRQFIVPPPSADEALALLLMKERLKNELPPVARKCFDSYFKIAGDTIDNLGPGNRYIQWQRKIAHVPPNQPLISANIRSDVYETVLLALFEDVQIRVGYRKRGGGSSNKYRVHPLGILLRGPVTYLVCTINDHTNPAMLALHRMQWARPEDSRVITPKGFLLKDFIAKGGGEFAIGESATGHLITLDAEFEPEVGQHFDETPLDKDQVLRRHDDGRWQLQAEVRDTQQLRWWLLAFGPRVEVIAPTELREWIAKEHQLAAKRYRKS